MWASKVSLINSYYSLLKKNEAIEVGVVCLNPMQLYNNIDKDRPVSNVNKLMKPFHKFYRSPLRRVKKSFGTNADGTAVLQFEKKSLSSISF